MRAGTARVKGSRMADTSIQSERTHVFPLELGRAMPVIARGDGVWIEDTAGRRYLDAMSGGSMAATLGHGRRDIIQAARAPGREARLRAQRTADEPAPGTAGERADRGRSGRVRPREVPVAGADANEMAIQLARSYHVERGERDRWQVISPAQAYHGPTMETLALTGRPGLHGPFGPYLPQHLHIPPSTWRFDPSGEAALEALDRALEEAGPENVSAFFCEAISAAALPAYTPPRRFWEGLAERRERHGFLVCFDEVVTGVGRTGNWFAGAATACAPDIIATAKGLGAGYAAIGAVLVPRARLRRRRRGIATLHARAHLGRRPARSGGGSRGAGGAAVGAARGAGPRPGPEPAGRARTRAGRHPDGSRGAWPRLPARRGVRRSARRRVVPAARAPGRGTDRPTPRSSGA